jgi:hypothetical protein
MLAPPMFTMCCPSLDALCRISMMLLLSPTLAPVQTTLRSLPVKHDLELTDIPCHDPWILADGPSAHHCPDVRDRPAVTRNS